MFDCHIHTRFSSDSTMDIQQAIKEAQVHELGIIITEHVDLNFPDKEKFRLNYEEYFKEYQPLRNSKLLLGVEIGMNEKFNKEHEIISRKYPFDFVLGSIHFLGNDDLFYPNTYEGKSKNQVYEQYLMEIKKNLMLHPYIDALGHIDYICRYSIYEDKELYYLDFSDLIDDILNTVINLDISLEINTRRLESCEAVNSILPIYKRYSELGGKYVTFGSDAHNYQAIGSYFKTALEIAEKCNLTAVHYKERKIIYS
jgi:histidinol-phosphatase (PHP family)